MKRNQKFYFNTLIEVLKYFIKKGNWMLPIREISYTTEWVEGKETTIFYTQYVILAPYKKRDFQERVVRRQTKFTLLLTK